MNDLRHLAATRRTFLRAAAAPLATPFLHFAPRGPDVRLLVIELEGGNDGLNTLIPIDDARYAKARPQLGSVRRGAHAVGAGFALHSELGGLAKLFVAGHAAAVHGVGYPQPDRSHFRSRDIWHTADPTYEPLRGTTSGWLGRAASALAGAPGAADVPALALGSIRLPLALRSEHVVVPVLERLEDFTLRSAGETAAQRAALEAVAIGGSAAEPAGDLHAFVRGVATEALRSADQLQRAVAAYRPRSEYPSGAFGRDLQLAARVLVSGLGTRLVHVPLGGFDTHAQQLPTHARLLRELGDGLAALTADLTAHGALEHTVILVHSEFGRRVAENGSLGTDHGAAAPVFLVGGGVRHALHGTPPDLGDLTDGDVRSTTDFRAIYGALLERLGIAAEPVLGKAPAAIALFE